MDFCVRTLKCLVSYHPTSNSLFLLHMGGASCILQGWVYHTGHMYHFRYSFKKVGIVCNSHAKVFLLMIGESSVLSEMIESTKSSLFLPYFCKYPYCYYYTYIMYSIQSIKKHSVSHQYNYQ